MAAKKKTAKPAAKKTVVKAPAKPAKKAAAPTKKSAKPAAKPVAKKAAAKKAAPAKAPAKKITKPADKPAAKKASAVKPAPVKKPAAKPAAKPAPAKKASAAKPAAAKTPAVAKPAPKKAAAPVKNAPATPVKAVEKPKPAPAPVVKPAAKVEAPKPVTKVEVAKPKPVYKASKPEISLADMEAAPANGQHHASVFVSKQKQRLLDLRDELVDAMSGMTRDTIRNAPEGSEASGSGMHQGDAGSDAYDRDFALSVLAKEQDSLYEIDQALYRIKKNVYGICEISGKKIPQTRLEAIPFARLTVECQAQWEKEYGNRRFRPSNEVGFSGGSYSDDEDSDTVSLDEDED